MKLWLNWVSKSFIIHLCWLWLASSWISASSAAEWVVSVAQSNHSTQACSLRSQLHSSWPDVRVYRDTSSQWWLVTGHFSSQQSARSTWEIIHTTFVHSRILDIAQLTPEMCASSNTLLGKRADLQADQSTVSSTEQSLNQPVARIDAPSTPVGQPQHDQLALIKDAVITPILMTQQSPLTTASNRTDQSKLAVQRQGEWQLLTLRQVFNDLVTYANQAQWEQALALVQQLPQLPITTLQASDLSLLGWIYLHNAQWQQAKHYFSLSLLQEERSDVQYGLAMSCLSLNQFSQAQQLTNQLPEGKQKQQLNRLLAVYQLYR